MTNQIANVNSGTGLLVSAWVNNQSTKNIKDILGVSFGQSTANIQISQVANVNGWTLVHILLSNINAGGLPGIYHH
jgi:hypothetical protein